MTDEVRADDGSEGTEQGAREPEGAEEGAAEDLEDNEELVDQEPGSATPGD